MPIAAQNIFHLNANCTDLVQSKRFFEDLFGLRAATNMRADPQPGDAMGTVGPVQWDGFGMQDASGWAGTMLDLLQWLIPPTTTRTDTSVHRVGYAWLAFVVPDLTAVIERAGQWALPVVAAADGSGCWLRNRDRLLIEARQADVPDCRLAYVGVNCRDLARTRAWYSTMLGMRPDTDVRTLVLPAHVVESDMPAAVLAQRMSLPGRDQGFGLQLMQPADDRTLQPPLAAPHEQGFYRMAVTVADAAACYEQLRALGADCPVPPCWLRMGPDVPVDGVWTLFFRDPDGTCVELIQTPEF